MSGIKPRLVRSLTESNTHWVEELDSVLWGLRTTPNRTTGFTPFFMVYDAEAVLPCDIIHDSPRLRLSSPNKRPGRTCKLSLHERHQTQTSAILERIGHALGRGARLRTLGAADHAKPNYRVHTIFYGVRRKGSSALRYTS